MTITIYLIRLLVSLLFGFLTILNIAFLYAEFSNAWNGKNKIEVIISDIALVGIWLGSAYLLWVIQ